MCISFILSQGSCEHDAVFRWLRWRSCPDRCLVALSGIAMLLIIWAIPTTYMNATTLPTVVTALIASESSCACVCGVHALFWRQPLRLRPANGPPPPQQGRHGSATAELRAFESIAF